MSIELRAEDEPVASRREYWQHRMHQMLVPLDIRFPRPDFQSRIVAGEVGVARVFELTTTEGEAFRTPGLIRRSDTGLCKVDLAVRGHTLVDHDGRQAPLRPGDFTLVDLSRPAHWSNDSAARFIAVSFPRALLPLRDEDLGKLTGVPIPGDQGAGALVSSVIRRLPRHLDDVDPAVGSRLSTAFLDLLAASLASHLDHPGGVPIPNRHQALLAGIHAYIENRLDDPGLSPAEIAAAHHISVRHLYALFERQDTSVALWIRRRRLERCRRDLLDPTLIDRPVSSIAARWGFTNPAHFSRLFRAAHGLPPGEFRARWSMRSGPGHATVLSSRGVR